MKKWVYAPHGGSAKLSQQTKETAVQQIESYEKTRPWFPGIRLTARWRSQFCYVDTVENVGGEVRSMPLCRLKYEGGEWSLALFTYSNDRYEPCYLSHGKLSGTIEQALIACDAFVL